MKQLLVVFTCLIFVNGLVGQDTNQTFDGHNWKAPYKLATPAGWGVERFLVPPGFAPQLTYSGVEDIRFTPGWAKAASEEYWTYAFVWYLDGTPVMNEAIIKTNLSAYYDGLFKTNIDPEKFKSGNFPPSKVNIITLKTKSGDDLFFAGTVTMNNYLTLQPISLHVTAQVRYYAAKNKTVIFYALSPKHPADQVWLGLNKLWEEFSYP